LAAFFVYKQNSFTFSFTNIILMLSMSKTYFLNFSRLLILLFFLGFNQTFSQGGLTERNQFNYLAVNPAFAGGTGAFGIRAVTESQLAALRFNKLSQILVLDGQLYGNTGLAFQGYTVNAGNLISTGLSGAYSKGFEFQDFRLRLGLNGGLLVLPNLLTAQSSIRSSYYSGLGLLASYKALLFGFSKPVLVSSKNFPESDPNFFQLGYLKSQEEASLNFYIMAILKNQANSNRLNLNSKVILKNKIGIGFSLRNADDFTTTSQKKITFYPFADFKFNKKMTLGLGYNPNSFIVDPQYPGSQIQNALTINGSIQFYVKYVNDIEFAKSWYSDL
jgi:hypothetical protein